MSLADRIHRKSRSASRVNNATQAQIPNGATRHPTHGMVARTALARESLKFLCIIIDIAPSVMMADNVKQTMSEMTRIISESGASGEITEEATATIPNEPVTSSTIEETSNSNPQPAINTPGTIYIKEFCC